MQYQVSKVLVMGICFLSNQSFGKMKYLIMNMNIIIIIISKSKWKLQIIMIMRQNIHPKNN